MPKLEKKQVISFLKILQIPTNQTPEEIELALKKAGWNKQDAKEAIAILHPEEEGEKKVVKKPQLVAQMSKPSAPPPPPITPKSEKPETTESPQKEPPPPVPPPQPTTLEGDEVTPKADRPPAQPQGAPEAAGEDAGVIDPSKQPPPQKKVVPTPPTPMYEKGESTAESKEQSSAAPTEVSFTPTHIPSKKGVAIVHEAPVSSDAMAQQMFRTDDRLSSETISGLLGIDIDVSQDDVVVQRNRRQPGITFVQLMVILIASITLAFAALLYGMYLFEVGPFHPTVDAFKAFSLR